MIISASVITAAKQRGDDALARRPASPGDGFTRVADVVDLWSGRESVVVLGRPAPPACHRGGGWQAGRAAATPVFHGPPACRACLPATLPLPFGSAPSA